MDIPLYKKAERILKGVQDKKNPFFGKVIFTGVAGVFTTLAANFLLMAGLSSNAFLGYLPLMYLILGIQLPVWGLASAWPIIFKYFAPEYIWELMKIKYFRNPDDAILIFCDDFGNYSFRVCTKDKDFNCIHDPKTGIRYNTSKGTVGHLEGVPALLISGSSEVDPKYAAAINSAKTYGIKSKKHLNDKINETATEYAAYYNNYTTISLSKSNLEEKLASLLTSESKKEEEINNVEEKIKEANKQIEIAMKGMERSEKSMQELKDIITNVPWPEINLKEFGMFMANNDPTGELIKNKTYYDAGKESRGKDDLMNLAMIGALAALVLCIFLGAGIAYMMIKG